MSKKNRSPINLVKIATGLANQRALWEPLVSYDPVARYYVRLARAQEFEAWLLTWLPGQGTDWHDHGGSAGAFITLRGVLTEAPCRGRLRPSANRSRRSRVGIGNASSLWFATRP
jgi:hypothetical protein